MGTEKGPSAFFKMWRVCKIGQKMGTEKDHLHYQKCGGSEKIGQKKTLCSLNNAEGHSEFMKHSHFILN